MEQLARSEHDRWAGDLVRKGWRWGPSPKDPENLTHPLLVDWDELAEEEREKDRDSIRSIPTMLALVGLELQIRLDEDGYLAQSRKRARRQGEEGLKFAQPTKAAEARNEPEHFSDLG